MPKYSASPFNAIQMALPGRPAYVWGGFADNISPTKMLVTNVALTTNVATLNVTVIEGNVPVVGSFITVQGTQQASGAFNVVAVALASVTLTNGVGTVTFALTHANVGSIADAGIAIVPQPVTFEAVSTSDTTQPVALLDPGEGRAVSGFSAEVIWAPGTSVGAVTVLTADKNDLAAFQATGTVITFPATRIDVVNNVANFAAMQLTTGLTGATTIAGRFLSK